MRSAPTSSVCPDERVTVVELGAEGDAALDELLAFATAYGTPRVNTAAAYRELMEEAAAWTGFIARAEDGEVRAAALPSIQAAIGLDQAQLNAFLVPGDQAAFDAALGEVTRWARERSTTHVTAHVSAPSEADLAAWASAGYEQVGERTRVTLAVTPEDATRPAAEVDGATITTLAERPELEASADELWRIAHDDVPSALRFSAADVPALRSELGVDPERSVALLAVDGVDRVVGLALLIRAADRSIAGHRMTATARDWRGRGVAHALKIAAIRWAAANGITKLQASNDAGNAPMQAVNARFGYATEYRLVLMRRAIA